jgi:type VI secretion system protein VasD
LRAVEAGVARAQVTGRGLPLNLCLVFIPMCKVMPMKSLSLLTCLCLLGGCAGSPVDGVLQATGLRRPAPLPEALQPPRKVALHLHAAPRLNLDARGRPLALLVRVYQLRQLDAFERAPQAAFLSPEAERAQLGADLVAVRELTLVPGQRLDLVETMPRDAGQLGVVALFHAPAPQGWRLAFAAADAERAGVTVGVHACTLSVGAGAAASGAGAKPLSLVRCQ